MGEEVEMKPQGMCIRGTSNKTHATLVLGPGMIQERGGKQASLGRPDNCGEVGAFSQVGNEWDDSGSRDERVIKLSEPRRKGGLPRGCEGVMVLRYSPGREVEKKRIDGKRGRGRVV